MAEYKGKYDQYSYVKNEDGTISVTETASGEIDILSNVERLRFDSVDINLTNNDSLPLPVKDNIQINNQISNQLNNGQTQFTIDQAQILSNDFSTSNKTFSVKEVSDAVGGTVELRADGKIIFTADPYFMGTMSFDYSVIDEDGIANDNYKNSDLSLACY
jgi:hypothetical protein